MAWGPHTVSSYLGSGTLWVGLVEATPLSSAVAQEIEGKHVRRSGLSAQGPEICYTTVLWSDVPIGAPMDVNGTQTRGAVLEHGHLI